MLKLVLTPYMNYVFENYFINLLKQILFIFSSDASSFDGRKIPQPVPL